MSFSIQINGHKEVEDAEKFEHEIKEKVEALVKELEGVTYATFSGGRIGSHDLLNPQAPTVESAPTQPTGPALGEAE